MPAQGRKSLLSALLLGMAAFPAHAAPSSQEDEKAIISFVFENDVFSGTDQNYTNGVRMSWLSSEAQTPPWARWFANNVLPLSTDGNKRIGIALGQNMYTPQEISRRPLITDDRPYGGWLYGSIGMVSDTGKRLDNVMLTVGVVGPYSYARQAQTFIHRNIGSPIPRGWDNQLKTEPGVVLTMERKWRAMYEFSPFGAGVDVTPHAGFNLGNVNTDASIGATFRLGYDLPADYGPPRIRPSLPGSDFFVPTKSLGGYLFAGVEGRAVARNIFLDGNTFADSHSVDKEILVGALQAGVAMTYGNTRLSYTHVFMTREFREQRDTATFGALTLSCRF